MRVINFSAGPSTLPESILNQAKEEFCDYQGKGFSIMEISHRSDVFEEIHFGAMDMARKLYDLSDDFEILFIQGGASMQFAMIPMNLSLNGKCEYVNTGIWTQKAIKEAKILNKNVDVIASSENSNFDHIPDFSFSDDADYSYICSNNTIYGTQYQAYPKTKSPLIIDASSDLFSKKVDFSNIALFYGGVQKNAGISGFSCVFIRKDMLKRSKDKNLPSMLNYNTYSEFDSMFNTPPTFAIYMFNLEMKWLLSMGGLDKINELNQEKAKILYEYIDNSNNFYKTYAKKDRSIMNVSFKINDELDMVFVKEANEQGLIGLKGHKILGGIRASIYNAISLEQVKILCDFMKYFQNKYAR